MKMNSLNDEERFVMIDKGTEPPFTGVFDLHFEKGNYHCKQCGQLLFHSDAKFKSNCGWPSFDEAIEGAVSETLDADGRRMEITCSRCDGHLGHVFRGEGYTENNTRYCVNSISLTFEK